MQIDITVSEKNATVKVDGSVYLHIFDLGTGIKVQSTGALPIDVGDAEAINAAQASAFSLLRMLRSISRDSL